MCCDPHQWHATKEDLDLDRESSLRMEDYEKARAALTNGHYLEDSHVTVEGLKVFGSSWIPGFNM